jgi:hypothetical protein
MNKDRSFNLIRLSKLTLCAAGALATFIPTLFAQNDGRASAGANNKNLEVASWVQAADFVPAADMSGGLYSVRPQAYNDGLRNTYYVDTQDGVMEVTGTPELIQRTRELYALDQLRQISGTHAFKDALAKSGEAKLQGAANLVEDPLGAIGNAPKAASRFFGRIGEGLKIVGKGGSDGGSNGGGNKIGNLLGVDKAKAKLALDLGVSPYTTNQELQEELTRVARATVGGGMVVDLATSAVSGGAGAALTVVGVSQQMHDILAESTPEDLRIINRKKLLALGLSRDLADQFLTHPWYSPWDQTIITDALSSIGVNPRVYLSEALKAMTSDDALYFLREALILKKYDKSAAGLRSIRIVGGLVTALDKNGTLVVPVSLDYAIWSERVAWRVDQFSDVNQGKSGIRSLTLWTDGRLSQRLCDELKTRNVTWQTQVLDSQN